MAAQKAQPGMATTTSQRPYKAHHTQRASPRMRAGRGLFLFETARVKFMNDLLLGLRAGCKRAERKLSAASCSGQW